MSPVRAVLLGGAALVLLAAWALGRALWSPPMPAIAGRPVELLADVTILNPGRPPLPHRSISIEASRIARIEEASDASHSSSERASWLRGAYVTPGLVDLHVHLPPPSALGQLQAFALLFLLHGVTSVRDTGSIGASALASEEWAAARGNPSPRIFGCGVAATGRDGGSPWARTLRDAAAATGFVEEMAARGADCIKVHRDVPSSLLDELAAAAQRAGLPLIGHLPAEAPWRETRIAEIQHVCDPFCWSMGAREISELVAAARAAGAAHTPTLVVYDGQRIALEDSEWLRSAQAALVPRVWREVLWDPRTGPAALVPPGQDVRAFARAHAALRANIVQAVARLHAAGVPVLAGTDAPSPFVVPGAGMHRELRLLVAAGLSPEEAWMAATVRAADALHTTDVGTIAAGAFADLLVFGRDPLSDLEALDSLLAVVADGRLYTRDELAAAVASQQHYFASPVYDAVSVGLARAALALLPD